MRIPDLSGTGGQITQGVARIGCKVRRYSYREGTLNHACVWWPILPVSAHSPAEVKESAGQRAAHRLGS